jgi:hypothetical protein
MFMIILCLHYGLELPETVSFTVFVSDSGRVSAEAAALNDKLLPEMFNPLTENAWMQDVGKQVKPPLN